MPRYDENGNVIPGTENEEDLQDDNNEPQYDDDGFTIVSDGRDRIFNSANNSNNEQQKDDEEVEFNLDDNEKENISNQLDNEVDEQIEEKKIDYPTYDEQIEVTDGTQDTLTEFDENTVNNFSVDFEETPVANVNYIQYNKTHPFVDAKTPERRSKNTVLALENALDLMPLKKVSERQAVDQFFYDFDRKKPGHEAAKQLSKIMDTYAFLGQLLNTNYAELSTTRLIQINQTVNTLLGKNGKSGISELISQFDRATDFEYADNDAVKAMHDVAAKLDQVAAVLERSATADHNLNVQEKLDAEKELHQAIEAQNQNVTALDKLLLNGGITTPFDKMADEYKAVSQQKKVADKEYYANIQTLQDAEQFFKNDEYRTWEAQAKKIQQLENGFPELNKALEEHSAIIEQATSLRDSTDILQRSAEYKADEAKDRLDRITKECKEKEDLLFKKISPKGQKIYLESVVKKNEYRDHLEAIRDTKVLDENYVDALKNPDKREAILRDTIDSRRAFGKACIEFADLYDRKHPKSRFSKDPTGYDVLKGLLENYKTTKNMKALQESLWQPMREELNKFVEASSTLSMADQLAIGDYESLCAENEKIIGKVQKEYADLAVESMKLRAKSGEQRTILNDSKDKRQGIIDKISSQTKQIEQMKNTWSPEFLESIQKNKKIVDTYPDIIKQNKLETTKLALKETALSQGMKLVDKIKEGGQLAREKYEKFMSIKSVKAFNDTKFDDIHAKLEAFNARIADKKGSHTNSAEYTAMTDALTKALGSTPDNLSKNLMELERKSQAYLDAKHSQFFVIGSKLRHVRLSFAEEMKGFANQYSKLYAESKPINVSEQQLTQLSIEESAKPNIKGLGDVKFPTEKQVENTMKELEEQVLSQYNKKDLSKDLKKDEKIINGNEPMLNI